MLALQGVDIFLLVHPDEAGYRWEVSRIEEVVPEADVHTPAGNVHGP